MEMTGKPAPSANSTTTSRKCCGEAEQIDYTESESLAGSAPIGLFSHAVTMIDSELIRINTDTSSIEAGGDASDDRVKMVIKPGRTTIPHARTLAAIEPR